MAALQPLVDAENAARGGLGRGRIVALRDCSSSLYQVH
jgi:hypothetical protein